MRSVRSPRGLPLSWESSRRKSDTLEGFWGLSGPSSVESGRKQVEVQGVLKDSPAAHGGLQPGDRILRINDHAIEGSEGVPEPPWPKSSPGDTVLLVIHRGSGTNARELSLTLTAGEGL